MSERFDWLVPMRLWPVARGLVPQQASRPQGGGAPRTDDEAMFAAITFVLVTRSAWRGLPKYFGVSWQTAHRRFREWDAMRLWRRIQDAVRANGAPADVLDWADRLAAAAEARGADVTRPRSVEAANPAPESPQQARRHAIRRYLPADVAERIFGPRPDN